MLREGNVFTGVCLFTMGGGRYSLPTYPLLLPKKWSKADGTHPIGMHSCFQDSNNYIARPPVFYGPIFTTVKVAL